MVLVLVFQRVPKPEKSYFRAGKFFLLFVLFLSRKGIFDTVFCFIFGRHNILGSREASWRSDFESVCKGGKSAERTDVCVQANCVASTLAIAPSPVFPTSDTERKKTCTCTDIKKTERKKFER